MVSIFKVPVPVPVPDSGFSIRPNLKPSLLNAILVNNPFTTVHKEENNSKA